LVERNLGIANGFPDYDLGPGEAIIEQSFTSMFPDFKIGDDVQLSVDFLAFMPQELRAEIIKIVRLYLVKFFKVRRRSSYRSKGR
jgi:hypothetical protein